MWLCLTIVGGSLSAVWLKPTLPATAASLLSAPQQTVLPAGIAAGMQFNVLSEYAGKIKAVHVSAGSDVKEGQILVELENSELSGQAASAARRVETAESRLRVMRVASSLKRTRTIEQERLASALHDRSAAQERLEAFSIEGTERALAASKRRLVEVQGLVNQGLATDSELQNAQFQEQGALRDVKAAQEHRSRLKQEVDQTESQVRLLQVPSADAPNEITSAESELEEARNALTITAERVRRLVVTAPGPGTLVDLPLRSGEWLPVGTRVARIVDLSTLEVSAPVSATVARKVAINDPVWVRLPTDPPLRLKAAVTAVNMAPDAVQHAYLIRVIVPNPDPRIVLAGLEGAIEVDHRGR